MWLRDRWCAAASAPIDWLVAITWEPQQTRTKQEKSCVFCALSEPRNSKKAQNRVQLGNLGNRRTRRRMERVLSSKGRRVRLMIDCEFL
jgi:hypothetical protein